MKVERICYWILIFALGLLLLKLQYCSGRKPCPTITEQVIHDTVVRIDSAKTEQPVPVSVRKSGRKPLRFYVDTTTAFEITKGDTVYCDTIDCNEIKDYSYKYEFPDGVIIVENSVNRNTLYNQMVKPVFKKTETTKYITQTDTLYKTHSKSIFYLGLGLYGNKTYPFRGASFSTSLKLKNDYIYSIGRLQHFTNEGYWFGEVKIPIKLKK